MSDSANLKRRNFLLNIGLGSAGAAAAALGGKALVGRTPQGSGESHAEPLRQGYRLSEHVNSYYRTARV